MKVKTAHTPGPWVAQERSNSMIDIHHSFGNVKGAITLSLCRVQSRESWIKESKANAALIAAAPDLLDALWVCVEHNRLRFGENHNTVTQGRAAIAKATGEST